MWHIQSARENDTTRSRGRPCDRRHWIVVALLTVHAALLSGNAVCHSPATNEIGHLPAGIAHWRYHMFHLYRVNPPLPRMVAAVPVLLMKPETDWGNYQTRPSSRQTIAMGIRFAKANGARTFRLFTVARLACLPFSLLGAYVCYRWAADLWGYSGGLVSLIVWAFNPMVLGHGALVMPDVPAAATGALACYLYWKWLNSNKWGASLQAGLALGLAELCKLTLLILFLLLPLVWLVASLSRGRAVFWRSLTQLVLVGAVAVYMINLGYGFTGTGRRLSSYSFASKLLSGREQTGAEEATGNRFRGTMLGALPVPFPKDYVLGIDRQRADFEIGDRSYFAGVWKRGGWWYYHLTGLLIKTPIGTLLLLFLAAITMARLTLRTSSLADELHLLLPAIAILVLVSSQTGFSNHVRYAIPAIPFFIVWCGKLGLAAPRSFLAVGRDVGVITTVAASVLVWPHSISFFNSLVGGPTKGDQWMLDSNIACGQDLLFVRDWARRNPQALPLHFAYFGWVDPSIAGIDFAMPPPGPRRPLSRAEVDRLRRTQELNKVGPRPGWYIVDVNFLQGTNYPVAAGNWRWKRLYPSLLTYGYFRRIQPVGRIAFSYRVYFIDEPSCNVLRKELGLPSVDSQPTPQAGNS